MLLIKSLFLVWISSYLSLIVAQLPTTVSQLPTTGSPLPKTGSPLPTTGSPLPTTVPQNPPIVAQLPIQAYQNIPPTTDLKSLPHNSLYLRWRPTYHIIAPGGHMNDPCGPMYDPKQKLYHIFYQSFPQHVQGGNTSWSHATSPDLVYWTDVQDWRDRSMVAIQTGPYPQYDWIGAFSGGAQAVNLHGDVDGNLTIMYTGTSKLPDHWSDPYAPKTEQQAIATSSDGGKTWQKYHGNPVLDGPPGGWKVTGLRDPIFSRIPELDSVLGVERGSQFYMLMGSGIRGVGPRIPLYTAPANDLTKWTFQGALFEVGIDVSLSGDESRTGSFGSNFELAGLYPLREKVENGGNGNDLHWTITMGAEKHTDDSHPVGHWALYGMGTMARRVNGSAKMILDASGVLDWGEAYAFNSFHDPVNDRRVIWGYIPDDGLNNQLRAQGFFGSLGLARELYIKVYRGVIPPTTGVPRKGSEVWTPETDGTYSVRTLSQRPLPDVISAIQSNELSVGSLDVSIPTFVQGVSSSTLHIDFTVTEMPQNGRFSVLLKASPGLEEYVNVTYVAWNNRIIFGRRKSSLLSNLNTRTFIASFIPFTIHNSTTGTIAVEAMNWSIFIDGSIIEIFINDRFAFSGHAYPSMVNSTGLAFEAGDGSKVTVRNISVWQTMKNVWPNRPLNASSPLVHDPYYANHLNFPNPYVAEGAEIYPGWKA